ncbi:uracil-DNA glycosylase-like protein [Aspergillus californicus]
MAQPASPTQSTSSRIYHGDGLVSSDDISVNQITSFNGVLNKYMHVPNTTTSSSSIQETKRQQDALDIENTSKRKRGLAPTVRRITRSKSRSITPASPSQSVSASPSPSRRDRRQRQRQNPSSPSSLATSLLRDTIPENLTLLLIGVNPGILTGTTGFAYAHPSNLFWKLLHSSGITTIRHPPSDTYRLPELYNVGNTNIVERPTRDASMLTKAEMDAGVPILEAKIADRKPEAVCLVGKGIWESVWRARKGKGIRKEEFRYGWQDESENMGRCEGWDGARVFVATTTSGLAAGMSPAEKQAVWNELGSWVVGRREAQAQQSHT